MLEDEGQVPEVLVLCRLQGCREVLGSESEDLVDLAKPLTAGSRISDFEEQRNFISKNSKVVFMSSRIKPLRPERSKAWRSNLAYLTVAFMLVFQNMSVMMKLVRAKPIRS